MEPTHPYHSHCCPILVATVIVRPTNTAKSALGVTTSVQTTMDAPVLIVPVVPSALENQNQNQNDISLFTVIIRSILQYSMFCIEATVMNLHNE